MRFLSALLVISAALAMFALAPVHAKWPDQQRREVFRHCMSVCQSGDASGTGACDTYCWCLTGEMEKAYPDPEVFVRLRQAKDPDYTRRVQRLDDICATR